MILTGPLGDLVCCLDESGTHDQSPIVTTGGYIATASAWAKFESRASAIFWRTVCGTCTAWNFKSANHRIGLGVRSSSGRFSPSCLTRFVMQLSLVSRSRCENQPTLRRRRSTVLPSTNQVTVTHSGALLI